MNKQILIRYINGTASAKERREVMEWAEKSKENRDYLASLMNMSAVMNDGGKRVSDTEYDKFIQRTVMHKNMRAWRNIMKYAAAVLLVASVTANIVWINSGNFGNGSKYGSEWRINEMSANEYKQLGPDSLIQEIYVVKGAKSKVTLPDGSIVWLNSDSKIKFPLAFSEHSRNVSLSGEAFFDVAKNEHCPMVVSLNNKYFVEVLGTKFNLRSYDNDNEVQATLYSGKINILASDEDGLTVTKICEMKPNETYIAKESAIETTVKKVSDDGMDKISAWKEGRLYFDETPMQEVLKRLERWHGINFNIKDNSVLDYTITAKFDNESAVQIMEMLKLCAPVNYSVKDNIITLWHK